MRWCWPSLLQKESLRTQKQTKQLPLCGICREHNSRVLSSFWGRCRGGKEEEAFRSSLQMTDRFIFDKCTCISVVMSKSLEGSLLFNPSELNSLVV